MGKKVIKLTESDIRKIVERVISEQGYQAPLSMDYRRKKSNVKGWNELNLAASGAGTNESGIEGVFNNMKSKAEFDSLNNELSKNPIDGHKSIVAVLNGELGYNDGKLADRIKNKLNSIGVNLTFKKSIDGDSVIENSFSISTGNIKDKPVVQQKDSSKPAREIGSVRVAPTEDFVKSGRAFVESTMSGELVKKIQQALIQQGFLKISKATNYFGPKTDAAVRAFQNAKGLKVDGKVGKNTYAALFAPAAPAEPERQFPEEITNIKPKGLANVTQGINTPSPITRQGQIQTATY